MYLYILKYKFVLPALLVLLFASCQKGGEPVPYGNNDGSADAIDNSFARLGGEDGNSEDDFHSSDTGTDVVGGDDNEDDDGIDIVGGDDNEDDDVTVTVKGRDSDDDDDEIVPVGGN